MLCALTFYLHASDAVQGHKFPPTLAMQFRSSLDDMMEALRGCEPFFVRCIKPNMMMQPTVCAFKVNTFTKCKSLAL